MGQLTVLTQKEKWGMKTPPQYTTSESASRTSQGTLRVTATSAVQTAHGTGLQQSKSAPCTQFSEEQPGSVTSHVAQSQKKEPKTAGNASGTGHQHAQSSGKENKVIQTKTGTKTVTKTGTKQEPKKLVIKLIPMW